MNKWINQVAQTRLTNRHQRPNIELCRDEPAHRLVEEVGSSMYLHFATLFCWKVSKNSSIVCVSSKIFSQMFSHKLFSIFDPPNLIKHNLLKMLKGDRNRDDSAPAGGQGKRNSNLSKLFKLTFSSFFFAKHCWYWCRFFWCWCLLWSTFAAWGIGATAEGTSDNATCFREGDHGQEELHQHW